MSCIKYANKITTALNHNMKKETWIRIVNRLNHTITAILSIPALIEHELLRFLKTSLQIRF